MHGQKKKKHAIKQRYQNKAKQRWQFLRNEPFSSVKWRVGRVFLYGEGAGGCKGEDGAVTWEWGGGGD